MTYANMSSGSKDLFGNRYYAYNKLFLTIVGLWPYQKTFKRLCFACFTIIVVIVSILAQVYNLVTIKPDAKKITDLLQTILPTITFACCYFNVLLQIPKMKQIFEHIKSDWSKLNNVEELMALQKYTDRSRICCRLIACIFYIYSMIVLFPTISCFFLYISGIIDDSQLTLIININIFTVNDFHYFVMVPIQIIAIFVIAAIGTAFFTTFIAIAQHACLLFNVLTMRIEQRFRKTTCKFDQESSNTKPQDELQWIISIIKYHNDVVNFSAFVKMLFGATYIMQVLMALLFIILDFFYVFQMIDMTITIGEAIRNSIFITGNLFIIYATSFLGQRLIDHGIKAYTECCLIPFYELSVETNKLLLLLTTRCMKPCCVSVGGMLIASNELFTKMTKISFSFATVFYNTRKAVM